jgi:hypothetical protein
MYISYRKIRRGRLTINAISHTPNITMSSVNASELLYTKLTFFYNMQYLILSGIQIMVSDVCTYRSA